MSKGRGYASLGPIVGPNRRQVLGAGAGMAFAALCPAAAFARNPVETKLHGVSSFGDLKYGPDYRHFDFAVPDAPTGGTFAFQPSNWLYNQNYQTFDTLNTFVLRGAAPPRMQYCFDTLMVHAWDEPDALYCALAENLTISADRNRYRFELRSEARFHDGSPVTAEDVVFSFLLMKEKGHPNIANDLSDLETIEAPAPDVVELVYNGRQSPRAILSVADTVPILARAWYEANAFDEATLTPPLSSGPWRVGDFRVGTHIEYERVRDYWANDLPFARGLDHFDRLRIDFFRERTAAMEAFKKGLVGWREEFTAKFWANEYDFPAAREGKVKRTLFPDELIPSLQAWAVNTRRGKFADPRTRQALGMLFDFEWTNRNLFHDAYTRTNSVFEGSDLAAQGMPSPEELALLEPLRGQVPEATFGEAVMQNVTDGTGRDRAMFVKANKLLTEAGWRKQDAKLVDAEGEQLTVEVLIRSQVFERMLGPFVLNMERMGIEASIRLVDASQFQARTEAFDFDLVGMNFTFEPNPTTEALKQTFHSQSADRNGSHNWPGISDPAVDTLIGHVERVETREELIVVIRALDRVLRANHFWIPNWHATNHRVAYWDMFGWRDPKPDYLFPVERLWWYEEDKARAIGRG